MRVAVWMEFKADYKIGLGYSELGRKYNVDRRTAKKYAQSDSCFCQVKTRSKIPNEKTANIRVCVYTVGEQRRKIGKIEENRQMSVIYTSKKGYFSSIIVAVFSIDIYKRLRLGNSGKSLQQTLLNIAEKRRYAKWGLPNGI